MNESKCDGSCQGMCPEHDSDMNEMRTFRNSLGLTQVKAAKLLKISTSTVISIEANRLKMSNAMRLRISAVTGNRQQIIDKLVSEYRAKLERSLP